MTLDLGLGLGLCGRRGGMPYVARFGVGADQATGTGAFDTSLYSGPTPPDGTFGAFTVSSGVITPSGSQTAGAYTVGGWPVQVIDGFRAVANQTQFDALTPANCGGKTVLIREAAGLTVTSEWNSGGNFAWATILGDGPDRRSQAYDVSVDARKHFISFQPVNTKKLILENLNIVTGSAVGTKVNAIVINFSGGGNTVEDIIVLNNRIICSRPDPFGDYSGGVASFPGSEGIRLSGAHSRCSAVGNVVIGACATAGAITVDAAHYAEIVGNLVDLFYTDGIRGTCDDTGMLVGGNLIMRPVSLPGDTGNPHSDGRQALGGKVIDEANAYVIGSSRGAWQSLFNDDFATEGRIRDNLIIDIALYQLTATMLAGIVGENNVWLAPGGTSLPIAGTVGGVRFGSISATGVNVLQNSVFRSASSIIDGTVTQTSNLNSSTWAASDYLAAFPDWSVDMASIPSLQTLLTVHAKPASGGAAAGKGPRVTFAGAERSSYVLGVAAPVISMSAPTPTSSGFSATLTTDTELGSVFWAVVGNSDPPPTWREIKERRATGGVAYGQGWIGKGETTQAINDSSLSPSTTYKLCAVQENGYSVRSNITASSFTTAASNISRVSVGAMVASNSATSVVMTIPTASNGDYLIAVILHRHISSEPTTPVGWPRIGDGVAWASGQPAASVYGRVRDGTEGATLTVSTGSAGRTMGFVAAYRSVSGNGLGATAASFNTTSQATPTLSATAQSCILHIWAASSGTITLPNPSDLVQSGYTPDLAWFLGVENLLSTSAGTTTARTATSGGSVWNAMQIELLKA